METPLGKNLGRRVAAYRASLGITQEELARRVRVTPETVSRIERGVALPSLPTLEAIGKVLGPELKEFFEFGGNPEPKGGPLGALVRELKVRSDEEIEFVRKLAREALKSYPRKSKR